MALRVESTTRKELDPPALAADIGSERGDFPADYAPLGTL